MRSRNTSRLWVVCQHGASTMSIILAGTSSVSKISFENLLPYTGLTPITPAAWSWSWLLVSLPFVASGNDQISGSNFLPSVCSTYHRSYYLHLYSTTVVGYEQGIWSLLSLSRGSWACELPYHLCIHDHPPRVTKSIPDLCCAGHSRCQRCLSRVACGAAGLDHAEEQK